MGRKKKVGAAGSFGPRYGLRVRREFLEVKVKASGWHNCPNCRQKALKRGGTGIWICRYCGVKFGGGAYEPPS